MVVTIHSKNIFKCFTGASDVELDKSTGKATITIETLHQAEGDNSWVQKTTTETKVIDGVDHIICRGYGGEFYGDSKGADE